MAAPIRELTEIEESQRIFVTGITINKYDVGITFG